MPYTFINNFNNNARLTRGANVLLYWPNVPPQSYLSVSYNYVWYLVRGARFVDHCTTVMHITYIAEIGMRVWFNIKHCRYLNRIHNCNVRGKLNLITQNAIVVEFCNWFQIYKRRTNGMIGKISGGVTNRGAFLFVVVFCCFFLQETDCVFRENDSDYPWTAPTVTLGLPHVNACSQN